MHPAIGNFFYSSPSAPGRDVETKTIISGKIILNETQMEELNILQN